MRRRNWLLALLGVGAAQAQSKKKPYPSDEVVPLTQEPPWRGCLTPQWSATCKATNRECPVCATMAEEYRPAYTLDDCTPSPTLRGSVTGNSGYLCMEEPEPRVKLARCKKCNAAFWVDMEKKEKL